jgi:hypothetical protein
MDIATMAGNFVRAMSHCDNLITVHKNHGGTGAGRRREETSLSRAVIVIAIASWQSFVQDAATSLAWHGQPPAGGKNTNFYHLVKGRVDKEIDSLNTPNANKLKKAVARCRVRPISILDLAGCHTREGVSNYYLA